MAETKEQKKKRAAYRVHLSGVRLPPAHKRTVTWNLQDGETATVTVIAFGHWAVKKEASNSYNITHIPSGKRLPRFLSNVNDVILTLKGFHDSGADFSAKELSPAAMEIARQVFGYLIFVLPDPPDYYIARKRISG